MLTTTWLYTFSFSAVNLCKTHQNCSKGKVIKLANGFRKPDADF